MTYDPLFNYFEEERLSFLQKIYKESSTSSYKEYTRFPYVALPEVAPLHVLEYTALLNKRKSCRNFSKKPLTKDQISALLFWSAGLMVEKDKDDSDMRRHHPSGGMKYPIELYPVILSAEDIKPHVYHYNVKQHSLERLVHVDFEKIKKQIKSSLDTFALNGGMIVLFSFVKSRSMEKYGALSYKLALIEAGHISQNMYLTTAALNLGCCALGTGAVSSLNRQMCFDGVNETILYSVVVGAIS